MMLKTSAVSEKRSLFTEEPFGPFKLVSSAAAPGLAFERSWQKPILVLEENRTHERKDTHETAFQALLSLQGLPATVFRDDPGFLKHPS